MNNFYHGSRHLINIESINSRGEGVGRINDWVIFVSNAVPGDHLDIEILCKKKNYSTGKIKKIIFPSPGRITPLCEHFSLCGGCSFQTMNYKYQLNFKNELFIKNIEKISKTSSEVIKDIIPSDKIWNYRNKVQQVLYKTQGGSIKLGFFHKDSHKVIHIKDCPIQHELSNKLMAKITSLFSKINFSIYNEKNHKGLFRYIISRTSFSNKEFLCILVTTDEILPYKDKFLSNLTDLPGLTGVIQNINKGDSNTVLGEKNIILWGKSCILEEIQGLKFLISSSTFFQINTGQVEKMYEIISSLILPLTGLNYVIDAYCGIGTFSLFLSNKAKYIYGIEENRESVKLARKNSNLNKRLNIEFLCGKVEELLYTIAYNKQIDLIILDPPRKGCEKKVIQSLEKLKIKHIIYISCNPATLARDILFLKGIGYKIELIQPIDMFPHTSHIESITKLSLQKEPVDDII